MTHAAVRETAAERGAPPWASLHGGAEPAVILMSVDAVGGVWRYAMELANGLPPGAYRLVFAVLGPRPAPEQEREARRHGDVVWLDQPLDWMVGDADGLSAVGPALSDLALRCGADLLHLNAPSQAVGLSVGVPVVTVAHSCLPTWWSTMRPSPLPDDWAWHVRLNQAGFAASDAIVVPSVSHAQAVAERYRCGDRLEVVHNGIAAFLATAPREPFLFAAGRWWDEGKNGSVLARAAAAIGWPVVMAGSLESPSGQRQDLDGVRTLGSVPHAAILDHMRRAEIVVSPSLYEPFGLAALEGARASAALLLADIPTYRELWKGAAVFFDPHDADDLASKARLLIGDPSMRAAYASLALARSRAFTPDRQAAAMHGLYRRCLGRVAAMSPE